MKVTSSTLLHPATAFIQSLPYAEVAYGDMTPDQQLVIWEYMDDEGGGVWADKVASLDEAKSHYADVRFAVGSFPNDDVFKAALRAASEDSETADALSVWFKKHFECGDGKTKTPPIILSHPNYAPEFGMLEYGYYNFYHYWSRQPDIDFVRFLPDWDSTDASGRGGQ